MCRVGVFCSLLSLFSSFNKLTPGLFKLGVKQDHLAINFLHFSQMALHSSCTFALYFSVAVILPLGVWVKDG